MVQPGPAGEFGTKAFRLVKKSGGEGVYDVVRTHDGLVSCDCASYEVSHKGTVSMCKHGAALVSLGLLDAPAYAPVPKVPAAPPVVVEAPAAEVPPADDDAESFADDLVEAIGPAPLDPPAEGGEDAYHWGLAILTRFGPVATDEQLRLAERHATDPETSLGLKIVPPGPSLTDLEARLAAGKPAPAVLAPVKPAPLPDGRYSLAELVEGQAALFRGQGNAPFDLMARALEDLAKMIRATGASNVADYEARIAVMDRERDDELRSEGYESGRMDAAGVA